MEQALGIAISNTEAQIAYLAKKKGKISILALESLFLSAPIKSNEVGVSADQFTSTSTEPEFEEVFAGNPQTAVVKTKPDALIPISETDHFQNTNEKLISFLNKFPLDKAKVAFNLPQSMVSYYYSKEVRGLRNGGLRKWLKQAIEKRQNCEISDDSFDYIQNQDGSVVGMVYDSLPPLLEKFEQIQIYRGDAIRLSLMDTSEISLINLVRNNYKIVDNEISAIIYIENDFSRIVFMKGESLLHCSELINESIKSSLLLDIIYSKMIYEQDQYNVPEVKNIFLAGKCLEINAHFFFEIICDSTNIQYINSKKIANFTDQTGNNKIFSEYALPISLAWKTLEIKNNKLIQSNLLPSYIVDRQKILKLAYHSYILIALLAIAAFSFTWKIISTQNEIRSVQQKKEFLLTHLSLLQQDVDEVYLLQGKIYNIRLAMTLMDSLGTNYNYFIRFLDNLNKHVKNTKSIWIKEIKSIKDGYVVRGMAMKSESISQLSDSLGNINLRKVIHKNLGNNKIYEFEFVKQIEVDNPTLIFGDLKLLDNVKN